MRSVVVTCLSYWMVSRRSFLPKLRQNYNVGDANTMNRAETIQEAKRRWERKPADFYATPPEVTSALILWLRERGVSSYFNGKRLRRVHEPCCGEGHISEVLIGAGFDVTSHDLYETNYTPGRVNYLTLPERDPKHYDYDMVVTNPPFSFAERFIRRAMRDAPVVAMFLPTDYWHAKTRVRLFRSRPPWAILALTWRPVFIEERGTSPLANYVWTVWADWHEGYTQYHLLDKP